MAHICDVGGCCFECVSGGDGVDWVLLECEGGEPMEYGEVHVEGYSHWSGIGDVGFCGCYDGEYDIVQWGWNAEFVVCGL